MHTNASVPPTRAPAEPQVPPATPSHDYAVLSSALAVGLVSVARLARGRGAPLTRVESAELPALALATFGLSRVLVHDRVTRWVRSPFVREDADGRPPRGGGLRRAVGELLTCTRCTGVWVGAGLVGARVAAPALGQVVTATFAAAGANDLLQAGFAAVRRAADGG